MQFFEIVGTFKVKEFHVLSLMAGGNQVAAEFVIEFEAPGTGAVCRDEEMHWWTLIKKSVKIRVHPWPKKKCPAVN